MLISEHLNYVMIFICCLSCVKCLFIKEKPKNQLSCSNLDDPILYTNVLSDEPTIINMETGTSEPGTSLLQLFSGKPTKVERTLKDIHSWQADTWLIFGVEPDDDKKYMVIYDSKKDKKISVTHDWSKYDDFLVLNGQLVYFESRAQSQKFYEIDEEFEILLEYGMNAKFTFRRSYPSIVKVNELLCAIGGNNTDPTPTECYDKHDKKWKINDQLPPITGSKIQTAIFHQSILYVCSKELCKWYVAGGLYTTLSPVDNKDNMKLFVMKDTVYILTWSHFDDLKSQVTMPKSGSYAKTNLKTKVETNITQGKTRFFMLISTCAPGEATGCSFSTKPYFEYSLNGANTLQHFPGQFSWKLEPKDVISYQCHVDNVSRDCKNDGKKMRCEKNEAGEFHINSDDDQSHEDGRCFTQTKCKVSDELQNIVPPTFNNIGLNAQLQLSCKNGYYVRNGGDQRISVQNSTCTCVGNNGKMDWLPQFWECDRARCSGINLKNGELKQASGQQYKPNTSLSIGKFLHVNCDAGYASAETKVECEFVGNEPRWSHTPQCNKLTCDPSQLEWQNKNGKLEQELEYGSQVPYDNLPIEYGRQLIVSCDNGYRPTYRVIKCVLMHDRTSAVWDAKPLCERIPCNQPTVPVNGQLLLVNRMPLNRSTLKFGDSVIVDCNAGFSASEEVLKCIPDGKDGVRWSADAYCQALTCDRLNSIRNGTIWFRNNTEYTSIDATPRMTLHVTCDEGFHIDNSTVECLIDETGHTARWSQSPQCSKAVKSADMLIILPAAICGFVVVLVLVGIFAWRCGCCHRSDVSVKRTRNSSGPAFKQGNSHTTFVRPNASRQTSGTNSPGKSPVQPIYETIPTLPASEPYTYDYPSYLSSPYLQSNSEVTHFDNGSYFFSIPR